MDSPLGPVGGHEYPTNPNRFWRVWQALKALISAIIAKVIVDIIFRKD
jgi:hypothetical protein